MDLSQNYGKIYTHVSLRGIRAGLQRHLRESPNPSTNDKAQTAYIIIDPSEQKMSKFVNKKCAAKTLTPFEPFYHPL